LRYLCFANVASLATSLLCFASPCFFLNADHTAQMRKCLHLDLVM
jgi:hypothetical protein